MALKLLDEDDTLTVTDSDLGLDDGDDDTTYTVRVVSPQVVKRLRKAHTKRKPTGGQGMADVLDAEGFGEALFDYVLCGWSGVLYRGATIGPDDMVTSSAGTVKAKTQLDGSRKAALLERAGANQTGAEGRADSFRPAP